MSEKILVPVLGESINEATVSKWLKKKGDTVETAEPLICPSLVILRLSRPEVLKAIVSTSGNLIFVFESPVWYIVSETSKLPVTVKLSLTVVLPIKVGIVPVVVCIVPNELVEVD